jgi:ribosomal protein L37E
MTVIRGVRHFLSEWRSPDPFVECRRCGVNINEDDPGACPECGSGEIVEYDL